MNSVSTFVIFLIKLIGKVRKR